MIEGISARLSMMRSWTAEVKEARRQESEKEVKEILIDIFALLYTEFYINQASPERGRLNG